MKIDKKFNVIKVFIKNVNLDCFVGSLTDTQDAKRDPNKHIFYNLTFSNIVPDSKIQSRYNCSPSKDKQNDRTIWEKDKKIRSLAYSRR
jgi:hypothetical protein